MVIPSGSIHEPALELRSGWYDVIVLITTGTYTQIELVDNKDPDTLDLTRTKIWANYGVVHRCFASLVRLCKHPTSTDDVYKEPVQFYSPTRLVADDIVLQEPYLTNSTGSQSSTVQKMEFGFFSCINTNQDLIRLWLVIWNWIWLNFGIFSMRFPHYQTTENDWIAYNVKWFLFSLSRATFSFFPESISKLMLRRGRPNIRGSIIRKYLIKGKEVWAKFMGWLKRDVTFSPGFLVSRPLSADYMLRQVTPRISLLIKAFSNIAPRRSSSSRLITSITRPILPSSNLPSSYVTLSTAVMTSASGFYSLKAELPNGEMYDFASLQNKTVLIVNVASKW